MFVNIVPQNAVEVKSALYKLKNVNMSEILTLADFALTQANQYRQEWLATNDVTAWRLWQACVADRRVLLEEVDGDG